MQRILDLLFSSLALLLLLPILLPIMLLLRITGEGKIFFLQNRVGIGGRKFKLYKFVTMLKNSPHIGAGTVTLKNDKRVLPFGRILRKTKINELPQLLNIILGSMSIVGPRPQAPLNFEAFPEDAQKIIIKVKPGLSGVGSILFRNEEEILGDFDKVENFYHNVIAAYKGDVESWYIENLSIRTYFSVIFVTIWIIMVPSSPLLWRVFPSLPIPPDELKPYLNYPIKN